MKQLAENNQELTPEIVNHLSKFLHLMPNDMINREQNRRTAEQVQSLEETVLGSIRNFEDYRMKNEEDKANVVKLFSQQSIALQEQSDMLKNGLEKVSIIHNANDTAKPLRDVGRDFVPNLTGEQMGVLLARIGLAQRYRKQGNDKIWETIPYNKDMNPPYPIAIARTHTLDNGIQVVNYHWYTEKVKKQVDKKLEKLNRLVEFRSLKTNKEIWAFINSL